MSRQLARVPVMETSDSRFVDVLMCAGEFRFMLYDKIGATYTSLIEHLVWSKITFSDSCKLVKRFLNPLGDVVVGLSPSGIAEMVALTGRDITAFMERLKYPLEYSKKHKFTDVLDIDVVYHDVFHGQSAKTYGDLDILYIMLTFRSHPTITYGGITRATHSYLESNRTASDAMYAYTIATTIMESASWQNEMRILFRCDYPSPKLGSYANVINYADETLLSSLHIYGFDVTQAYTYAVEYSFYDKTADKFRFVIRRGCGSRPRRRRRKWQSNACMFLDTSSARTS